jgi:hypothetical protein
MIRVSNIFVSVSILITLLENGESTSNNPAFLSRGYYCDKIESEVHRPLLRDTFLEDILDCDANSEDSDSETRFALQHENEKESLRYSESSYLLRDRNKPMDSSVVSASLSSKSKL